MDTKVTLEYMNVDLEHPCFSDGNFSTLFFKTCEVDSTGLSTSYFSGSVSLWGKEVFPGNQTKSSLLQDKLIYSVLLQVDTVNIYHCQLYGDL